MSFAANPPPLICPLTEFPSDAGAVLRTGDGEKTQTVMAKTDGSLQIQIPDPQQQGRGMNWTRQYYAVPLEVCPCPRASHHIPLYPIMSFPIMSFPIISFPVISFLLFPIISFCLHQSFPVPYRAQRVGAWVLFLTRAQFAPRVRMGLRTLY